MTGQVDSGAMPPPLPGTRRLRARWVVALCIGAAGVFSVLLMVGVRAGGQFDGRGGSGSGHVENGEVVSDDPPKKAPVKRDGNGQDPGREDDGAVDERDQQRSAKRKVAKRHPADDDGGKNGRDAFADIRARNKVLALPVPQANRLLVVEATKRLLATIQTNSLGVCELELVPQVVGLKGAEYEIMADPSQNDELRRVWRVQRRHQNGGGLNSKKTSTMTIGSFELVSVSTGEVPEQVEQRLYFTWGTGVRSRWAAEFRGMQLAVRVGPELEVCNFIPGVKMTQIAIRFEKRRELGPDLSAILSRLAEAETEELFVDFVLEGFPDGTLVSIKNNGRGGRQPLRESSELLRGICLWDLSRTGPAELAIDVGSVVGNEKMPCVKFRVLFAPPEAAGHKGLSVKWDCEVVVAPKGEVRRQRRQGLTLKQAEWELEKMPVLEKAVKRQLSDAKKQQNALGRTVGELQVMIDKRFRAVTLKELEKTQQLFKVATQKIRLCNASYQLLDQYRGIPTSVLACMVQLHEGRARIGWEIYEKRGGRRVNLAVGR